MSAFCKDNSQTFSIKYYGKIKKLKSPTLSSIIFSYPSNLINPYKYVKNSIPGYIMASKYRICFILLINGTSFYWTNNNQIIITF